MKPATVYLVLAYAWCFAVLGTCTYIVFWMNHSGWWYVLAIILCSDVSAKKAAMINGTWKPEYNKDYEDDE